MTPIGASCRLEILIINFHLTGIWFEYLAAKICDIRKTGFQYIALNVTNDVILYGISLQNYFFLNKNMRNISASCLFVKEFRSTPLTIPKASFSSDHHYPGTSLPMSMLDQENHCNHSWQPNDQVGIFIR